MLVEPVIISKKLPEAPTLKEMGLETSMHASALSEALPPLVDAVTAALTVALRSTSRPASRSTNTVAELSNVLIPKLSCRKVCVRSADSLAQGRKTYRRDKVRFNCCLGGYTWVKAELNRFKSWMLEKDRFIIISLKLTRIKWRKPRTRRRRRSHRKTQCFEFVVNAD